MLLAPKPGIIYGPVRSRRLGCSLGINVLPPGRKLCSFNCVYCQYGWTRRELHTREARRGCPSVETVRDALEHSLAQLDESPQFLTFSGNGEPTLHPFFADLVNAVLKVRDIRAPSARVAILSNSSQVSDEAIRKALLKLDVRIMKLDAGETQTFLRFNHPIDGITLSAMVEGLLALGQVTLQSLFAAGSEGNLGPDQVEAWLEAVTVISPIMTQIYTLDRGVPCSEIAPAPLEQLNQIRDRLAKRGIVGEVFPRS